VPQDASNIKFEHKKVDIFEFLENVDFFMLLLYFFIMMCVIV